MTNKTSQADKDPALVMPANSEEFLVECAKRPAFLAARLQRTQEASKKLQTLSRLILWVFVAGFIGGLIAGKAPSDYGFLLSITAALVGFMALGMNSQAYHHRIELLLLIQHYQSEAPNQE